MTVIHWQLWLVTYAPTKVNKSISLIDWLIDWVVESILKYEINCVQLCCIDWLWQCVVKASDILQEMERQLDRQTDTSRQLERQISQLQLHTQEQVRSLTTPLVSSLWFINPFTTHPAKAAPCGLRGCKYRTHSVSWPEVVKGKAYQIRV